MTADTAALSPQPHPDPAPGESMLRITLPTAAATIILALSFAALAQQPSDPAAASSGPPDLLKPVENASLGQLNLPSLWDVENITGGLRATETGTLQPGAIEIVFVTLPEAVPAKILVDAWLAEASSAHAALSSANSATIDNGSLDTHGVELTLDEDGVPMRYALVVVAGDKGAYFATLGAPVERFESLHPRALLVNILNTIKAP